MLKVKTNKKLGVLLALCSPVLAQAEPEFLAFYPECGYEVVDTVVHSGMIRSDLTKTAQYYVTQRLERLRPEMFKKAQEQNIKYLVLKAIKLIPARDGAMRFRATVEHLKTCNNPYALGGEPTPYDPSGKKSFSIGKVKMGESRTIVFEVTETIKRPDFGDNIEVSLANGVYGIPLGTSRNDVLKKFGSPSFWYNDGSGSEFFAYGRRHWLTFEDDKLVIAQYGDPLFNKELINYFVFDERFDDRKWQIQGEIDKGILLKGAEEASPVDTLFKNDGQTLAVITEVFLENEQKERNQRAVGFELKDKNAKEQRLVFSDAEKRQNQRYLYSALVNLNESDNLEADAVRDLSIGRTSSENSKQFLLLDDATLVQTVGEAVNKIFLSPGLIRGSNPSWQFGEFHSGQDMDEVLKIAGSNAFYMDGVLTIEKGRYTMTLYADTQDGKDILDAAEIAIY